jgi:Holliday junction resolvase RusA-like endonuclease
VEFHLLKSDKGSESRWQKDLDNLLKVALDVLKKDADERTLVSKGLGLIDDDKSIFGVYCSKDFVNDENKEGVDIAIYDARSVKVNLEK